MQWRIRDGNLYSIETPVFAYILPIVDYAVDISEMIMLRSVVSCAIDEIPDHAT